jgi:trk system potassium uptake protein TrkH
MTRHEFDGAALEESEGSRLVQDAGVLAALWAVFLWAGILMMIHVAPERPLSEVVLEVASAQGNVGLSTGITHPSLPWQGKLTLMLSMWIGRLEIIPVLILFSSVARWLAKPFQRAVIPTQD